MVVCSCVKDKPQDPTKESISINSGNTVFVINEGPFNSGHGSVSLYDPNSNSVVEDYYYQQNNSYLGNIVQSVTKYNNKYYIVNNNYSLLFGKIWHWHSSEGMKYESKNVADL